MKIHNICKFTLSSLILLRLDVTSSSVSSAFDAWLFVLFLPIITCFRLTLINKNYQIKKIALFEKFWRRSEIQIQINGFLIFLKLQSSAALLNKWPLILKNDRYFEQHVIELKIVKKIIAEN